MNSSLYSIAGQYAFSSGATTPFGGFFIKELDGVFSGCLIDVGGPSTIFGSMGDENIGFEKKYPTRDNSSIDYKLVKKGDLWVGTWKAKLGEKGKASCKIDLCMNDVNFDVYHRDTQDWTGGLMRKLIKDGKFEEFHSLDGKKALVQISNIRTR